MFQKKTFHLKARLSDDLSQFKDLKIQSGDSVYFMGICGTAMASLAVHLKQSAFEIQGSDENIYPPMSLALQKAGISVFKYNAGNIKKSVQLIVVGNVISSHHPEMQRARELKIPCLSFPEFMEQTVLSQTKNLVVAGTHGKSTSASLLSYAGKFAGPSPGGFIGVADSPSLSSFHISDSPWFVVEGDEYDSSFFAKRAKFFYYNPYAVLLTGIEFDHGDIYSNLDEIKKTFREFLQKVPKEGFIVACRKNKHLDKVTKQIQAPLITYGTEEGDGFLKNRKTQQDHQSFDICYKEKTYSCSLPLLGEHNALNALGVFIMSQQLKWPAEKVLQAFREFPGVRRRLEFKGYFQKARVYEDFAHHPTAIRSGLLALKEAHPQKRLIALFEPRSFTSRLNIFQKDYISAFEPADLIFLAQAYNSSKIPLEKRFSEKQLVQDLKSRGKKAFDYECFEALSSDLMKEIKEGDIVVFMSSGAFGGILQEMEIVKP